MYPRSEVFFTSELSADAIWNIYKKLSDKINGKVGLKVHFGEKGNKYFIKPEMLRKLAKNLKALFVETNVLYASDRSYTKSHIELAAKHGFDPSAIDILDDEGQIEFPVDGKHFQKAKFGSHISNYDYFVICSHFKGHALSGFGGAIKNVSMGMASIAGKMDMHASTIPKYKRKKCVQCGLCIPECPANAITINPVTIDRTKCIGCGKCIGICPEHVFSVPWKSTSESIFMERMCEYAQAFLQENNAVFINVLADISKDCDCMSHAARPFVRDIGILGSTDIVAAENASYDLVDKYFKSEDSFEQINNVSGRNQIEYAHKIGLGNMEYDLIDLDK
ncbi:MAG: DUF362 domain-containing protein [Candidatus Cloacimonadota bacterium]|nr:DUF362 domain-containing protein [Candidatus Cloacimonadota bacterium]